MTLPLLEIRDLLVVRNGMPALSVPALAIEEGRVYSLIGPNGAGKSTLLLSLMHLIRPDRGMIRYRSDDVPRSVALHLYRRKLAMVFQEPLLLTASVYDNVAAGLKMRGMKRAAIRNAVEGSLDLLKISSLAKRSAGALSGGESQRVSIARALAVDPEILLMDEPFSSLDAPTREVLITDLDRIIRDRSMTTVFATHDRSEAIRLADEVIVLNNGIIVQTGSPHDIVLYPASEFVANFMGTETILTGTVVSSGGGILAISVNGVSIEAVGDASEGTAVTFCIHPDNIVLASSRLESSARNSFCGTVAKIVSMGFFYKIYVDCGFTLVAYATSHSADEMRISEGTELVTSFKATAVHIIKMKQDV